MQSNLVKQVKFSFGIFGALVANNKQLVLAGLATTKILQSFLADNSKAWPYSLKIFPFMANNSFLSIPYFLGNPPMKTPTSRSLNKTLGSDPVSTELTNG